MPLETATYITDLNPSNPAGTDSKSQGDDHLKLIKSVLKSQFPSLGTSAVTVTAGQINSIPTLAVAPAFTNISDAGATITWNCPIQNSISLLILDGNKTLNLGSVVIGWHTLLIVQNTPTRTITWNSVFKHFGVGSGFTPDLGSAAGHKTVVSGFYDGSDFLLGNSPKHY